MPIRVACVCGKQFQTKDEYLGRTTKCPGCGKPVLIQPAAEPIHAGPGATTVSTAPVTTAPKGAVPVSQAATPHNFMEEAEHQRRAQKVIEERERQAAADRAFLLKFGLATGLLIIVGGMIFAVVSVLGPSSKPTAQKDDPPKDKAVDAGKGGDPGPVTPPTPPPEPPKVVEPDLSGFQPKDDVDYFLLMAMKSKDWHHRMNARIFRPDETRLDFTPSERTISPGQSKIVNDRLARLASSTDMDLGPQPSPEKDLVEARMLMDPEFAGSGLFVSRQAGLSQMLIFIESPKIDLAEVKKRFGEPQKSLASGDFTLHFYGRIVVMADAQGKVDGFARKVTRVSREAK